MIQSKQSTVVPELGICGGAKAVIELKVEYQDHGAGQPDQLRFK
jgi:hypothetical protein